MINVFVSGKVIERKFKEIDGIKFIEPYKSNMGLEEKDSEYYVPIDLTLINKCDICLLILETGDELNSLFEVGYCFAKNKTIIILDLLNSNITKYNFTKQLATSILYSYDSLHETLKRLSWNNL